MSKTRAMVDVSPMFCEYLADSKMKLKAFFDKFALSYFAQPAALGISGKICSALHLWPF